ncbi:MAG: hypothetical protein OQK04_04355, partial [Kangiellaceae bacterium]|nr:hypothetical protein [Kangiellaceae bacterium]
EDFELSKKIVEQAKFGHVHIFSYSDREGTKAARLPNKIDNETKKKRSKSLHQLTHQVKLEQIKKLVSQTQSILWEGRAHKVESGHYRYFGHTENYHKVQIDLDEPVELTNQIILCEFIDVDPKTMALVAKPLESLNEYQSRIDVQLVE